MADLDVVADTIRVAVFPDGHLEARDGAWWRATWSDWATFLVMYDTTQKLFVRAGGPR